MYPSVQKNRLFCAPAVLAMFVFTANAIAEETEEKSLDLPTVEVTSTGADSLGYIELEEEPVVGKLNVPIMDQPFSMSIIDDDFMKDTGAKNYSLHAVRCCKNSKNGHQDCLARTIS